MFAAADLLLYTAAVLCVMISTDMNVVTFGLAIAAGVQSYTYYLLLHY